MPLTHLRRIATVLAAVSLLSVVVPANALTFSVIGDWGLGGYQAGWFPEIRSANTHNRVCKMIGCNFTLSVGDNIYVGNVLQGMQTSFEEMYNTDQPFFPTLGNHDNAGPQLQYSKTNGKRWKFPAPTYTYTMPLDDTGHTVQIFAVNTNDGSLGGGGQYVWLESQLKASTARWKFIFGHFPTVGSGRHRRSGSVGRIHQLMKDYNAQAYFCGHDHILEMSNFQGRVLGISGAMARGGMMLRGIGGATRKFTVTHPSEYNVKNIQDWPGHGIISVRLSPNVMNVQLWDQYEALQYDFSVTQDWMKQVESLPDAVKNNWPPPDVVLKAYKAEIDLPKGPGGGQVFAPGGEVFGTTTTLAPVDPNAPTRTTLPPATVKNDIDKDDSAAHSASNINTNNIFMKYSVSTECVIPCNMTITMGYPFSVYLIGATVTSSSRMFISTRPIGCENKDMSYLLSGTDIVSMRRNVVTFTPSKGDATAAYVCYSADQGKSYVRLTLFSSMIEEANFIIQSTDLKAPAPTGEGGSTIAAVSTTAPPSPTSAAVTPTTTTPSGGHSTITVVVIVILCMGVTAVGVIYYVKTHMVPVKERSRSSRRRSRRQRYEQLASGPSGSETESTDDELAGANEPAPAASSKPTKKKPSKKDNTMKSEKDD